MIYILNDMAFSRRALTYVRSFILGEELCHPILDPFLITCRAGISMYIGLLEGMTYSLYLIATPVRYFLSVRDALGILSEAL